MPEEHAAPVDSASLFRSLAWFHFAAWEFPLQSMRLPACALPDQNCIPSLDDCGDHLNHVNIGA